MIYEATLDRHRRPLDNVEDLNTRPSGGSDMATMNFSVPDDVRAAFNKAFAGTNKSALLTGLIRHSQVERARRSQRP